MPVLLGKKKAAQYFCIYHKSIYFSWQFLKDNGHSYCFWNQDSSWTFCFLKLQDLQHYNSALMNVHKYAKSHSKTVIKNKNEGSQAR